MTFQSCYLAFVVHIAAINSLEIQIFGNACVDKNTDKSTICHHELPRIDIIASLNTLTTCIKSFMRII